MRQGWGGTGLRLTLFSVVSFFFFFCSFSYSQPQFENVTWNVLEINNSQVFISFHFSFGDKSLTVAQADFKLLPQPPDFGVMVVCHLIRPVHKFIIIYYNTNQTSSSMKCVKKKNGIQKVQFCQCFRPPLWIVKMRGSSTPSVLTVLLEPKFMNMVPV